MQEYKLPTNDVGKLVLSYKVTKAVEYDNSDWDKVHWARCAKSAKLLLGICGSLRAADACLLDLGAKFDDQGLSWTLETILKHATDWINRKRGANATGTRQRLFSALAEQRSKDLADGNGKESGAVRDAVRGVPKVPLPKQKDNHAGTGSSDAIDMERVFQELPGPELDGAD